MSRLIAFDAAMNKEANKHTYNLFTTCFIIFMFKKSVLYYFVPFYESIIKKHIIHVKTYVTIHFHTQYDLVQSHHRLPWKESDVAVSEQGTLTKLTWRWRTLHFHKTREFLYCPGAQSAQNKAGNEKRFIETGCGNGVWKRVFLLQYKTEYSVTAVQ
jgi:hypothetical protein